MQARFAVVVKDDGFVIKRAMRAARGGLQVASFGLLRLPQLHDVVKSLINRLLGNKTPRRVGWSAGWLVLNRSTGRRGWMVESANLLTSTKPAENDTIW